jgi:heme-degrading monooxygenase HmoA
MVVRVWRGKTRTGDADGYQDYRRSYEGYRKTPGYGGSLLLRKEAQEETEFVLISLWTSMDAIAAYAGADRREGEPA